MSRMILIYFTLSVTPIEFEAKYLVTTKHVRSVHGSFKAVFGIKITI